MLYSMCASITKFLSLTDSRYWGVPKFICLTKFALHMCGITRYLSSRWDLISYLVFSYLFPVQYASFTEISSTIRGVPCLPYLFEIVTKDRIRWPFSKMYLYKSPGQDGILPAFLRKGGKHILIQYAKFIRHLLPDVQGPRSHGVQGVNWPHFSGVGSTYGAWPLTFCRVHLCPICSCSYSFIHSFMYSFIQGETRCSCVSSLFKTRNRKHQKLN